MKSRLWMTFVALAVLSAYSASAADKEEKGKVVELDGLKSRAPAQWKTEKPASEMRLEQFSLPKVEGDDTDADLVIFKLGGSTKDNIARWKAQFSPPEGKKIDDVAKQQDMKVGDATVTYLDIHGTYKAPPFDPKYKGARKEKFRLLGVIFETKNATYQIRLIGPEKTVAKYKKGFDEWIKGFK